MPKSRSAPRLADVAARAGVSIATASRSLAGREGVSESVAAHVREVALGMGYVANVHARTLAGGATSTVGLIVHEIGDPYFAEIASGVIEVAAQRGLTVQICHSARDPRNELHQIRTLIAHRTDAIVVAGSGYTEPDLQAESNAVLSAFQETGGRVAVIGRHHLAADAVRPDNEAAGTAIAEHLLELGHRRIGVLAGPAVLTTVADRITGVAAALEARGMTLDDVPVLHTDFTRNGGRAGTERLLAEHPDLTALIALNDVMAIGVLSELRSRGVAVPARISVAGVDDVAVAADLSPSLTTVRLPMAEMGEMALTMALKPPSARRRRKNTGHELIVRDSTGPAPA
ncbi:LacI family DNA-binding transcriptional regulator [Pseudonocardia sichuanensis]|uniref:LacI family transcriptional regulator n=1 Tax=Pseudonocardia kunmingensis TaxID=630975 RepID=A0A543DN77_9PSEU|nr:LacI family DNA-binding transcriptional regulator [Pseudonocardia kunmingensis]TQM10735.1 LacI family transcriptional regulator [Pseudonocardia kunmingensis]